MDNEITINGEVYVRKSSLGLSTEPCDEIEEKPWPQEGDAYFVVGPTGKIAEGKYVGISENEYINFGNFFRTKEEAQMYSLRLESLSKLSWTKEGIDHWTWNFLTGLPHVYRGWVGSRLLHLGEFRTKEECQEWYDKYGASWLYLINNNKK